VKLLPLGIAGVAAACAVWFGVQASLLQPEDDEALVDQTATAQVTQQVGAAVKALFSYDYANLDRTSRAAAEMLTGAAVQQYQSQFTAARKRASDEKLVRSTTVRSIGVRSLRGDDASLLVFVDQQTILPGGGAPKSSVGQLSVTAHRVDGQWKITGLDPL